MFEGIYNQLATPNVDRIYDVADVKTGYSYWFWKLLNICISMFDYEGLTPMLPAREIELNLILTDHCVIFQNEKNELITTNTNIFGYDVYYYPTEAIYGNPSLRYKKLTIGMNCEVIYNNNLMDNIEYIPSDGSLRTFIMRYARQLADIESTINIYLVNTRMTSYPVAANDRVANSIQTFFKKLRAGKNAIISDNNIVQEFRNVDINRSNIHDGINDLLIARDKILEQFYRDIGVRMYNPKKAQVTEDEIQVNDQMLLISKDDMLKQRKAGLERVNDLFGTNITVKVNERFDVEKGVVANGTETAQKRD